MDEINKKIHRKRILLSMENAIAKSCYNGNVQNYGPWGVPETEGRFFRFPITLHNNACANIKTKIPDVGVSMESLRASYYKFGANELHVLDALEYILQNLEKEFDLNIYGSCREMVPIGYSLKRPEVVFEAKINCGMRGCGWIFENPTSRDVYQSESGEKYVLFKDCLTKISEPDKMKKIIEASKVSSIWYRFNGEIENNSFFSFLEIGSTNDIAQAESLLANNSHHSPT